ncbi:MULTISPECIES: gluconate 2-dehydrogenase subunit 3 family protein [Rhodomicrobium]|uniref:gluconate 2-dehydrogenase subunit 3 family protein n=1 Tax=Rhodomicrobium TaxID=1068 RepID=UPI001482D499|nr:MULTISPECIES: gluconate 2-dehydrogenase subunit 3 family protein [Rhodomicrobium]
MHDPSMRKTVSGRRRPPPISRRSMLAGGLAAGAALMTSGDAALTWSRVAAGERAEGLSDACCAFIDIFCETLIPDTDTPGARSANVPKFLSLFVASAPGDSVAAFEANVALICADLEKRAGAPFQQLAPKDREAVLAAFDADAIDKTAEQPYYASYVSLRVLTVLGYYTSHEGGAEELRYELVPGRHEADIPLDPAYRAFSNAS